MKKLWKMMIAASFCVACGSDDEGSKSAPNKGAAGSSAERTPMCPANRPMDGETCSSRGLTCEFEMGDCTCNTNTMAAFGALLWDCPVDFRAQMCPATAPAPGGMCRTVFGECPYGADKICDCADDTDTWACWNPADCPAMPPESQSACDPVGMECEYDDLMMDCDCTSQGWDCD